VVVYTQGGVEEVMSTMDDYFISKDDWDTIVELGVGENRDEGVLKKIPGSVKTAFTRKYNQAEHPIPFYKAQELGKAPKKIANAGPAPDIEDAYEVGPILMTDAFVLTLPYQMDELDDASDGEEEVKKKAGTKEEELIGGDKLIKAPKASKAKAKPKETAAGKGRAKAK
jgi:replication factor C subunit 1